MQNRKFPHADTGGCGVGAMGRDVEVGTTSTAVGKIAEGSGGIGRVGAAVGVIAPGAMDLVGAGVSVPRITTRGVTGGKVRDAFAIREGTLLLKTWVTPTYSPKQQMPRMTNMTTA